MRHELPEMMGLTGVVIAVIGVAIGVPIAAIGFIMRCWRGF